MKHQIGEKVKLYAAGYHVINGVIVDILAADYFKVLADNGYIYNRYSFDLEGWK